MPSRSVSLQHASSACVLVRRCASNGTNDVAEHMLPATQESTASSSPPPPPPPPPPPVYRPANAVICPADIDRCKAINKRKVKTALCVNYVLGVVCPFADHCAFAHGEHELRVPAPSRVLPRQSQPLCAMHTPPLPIAWQPANAVMHCAAPHGAMIAPPPPPPPPHAMRIMQTECLPPPPRYDEAVARQHAHAPTHATTTPSPMTPPPLHHQQQHHRRSPYGPLRDTHAASPTTVTFSNAAPRCNVCGTRHRRASPYVCTRSPPMHTSQPYAMTASSSCRS